MAFTCFYPLEEFSIFKTYMLHFTKQELSKPRTFSVSFSTLCVYQNNDAERKRIRKKRTYVLKQFYFRKQNLDKPESCQEKRRNGKTIIYRKSGWDLQSPCTKDSKNTCIDQKYVVLKNKPNKKTPNNNNKKQKCTNMCQQRG